MKLTPVEERFILHWGEMGNRWGINRTIAETHALLYISPKPLNAEQIVQTLSVARSNVSTSLRELQNWGIIRIVHVRGDRRDHFEALTDVWEMFQIIIDQRMRREVNPTIEVLRDCLAEAEQGNKTREHTRERLRNMLDYLETMTNWYRQLREMPTGAMVKLAKLGGRVQKLLGKAS